MYLGGHPFPTSCAGAKVQQPNTGPQHEWGPQLSQWGEPGKTQMSHQRQH